MKKRVMVCIFNFGYFGSILNLKQKEAIDLENSDYFKLLLMVIS